MTDGLPLTLQEAAIYFADLDRCHAYMRRIRWPDGKPACAQCESKNIGEITTRRMLKCRDCGKQFSVTKGTVFESSKITLDKWMLAVWLIANCKNGISGYELQRALDVAYPTAWFMLHRIRYAMEPESPDKFDGPAEADTTYVGGEARNMHKRKRAKRIMGRGAVGKAIVHGVLQRGTDDQPSQVRAEVVGRDDADRLVPAVRRNVRFGAEVYTDAARAYADLADTQVHRAIDHSIAYAQGVVHTNGLENFWTLLKRTLGGTYVAVAPFHLCRYVAEQAFRFNERLRGDLGRFEAVMRGIIGKRLTYRTLTAQDDAGFMGLT